MPAAGLLAVDGTGLAWRAACGFPRRVRSRSGRDITAVFGFFALLRKTHREYAPGSEIVVCFDSETAPNPRRDAYPAYKAHPGGTPAMTPFEWFPALFAALDLLSIPWCEAQRWEADDDIATLIGRLDARRGAIMSADHDFLQLVSRAVRVITPRRTYRVGDVVDRYGIHPTQWCDYRALTGDPADNIPGIRGIGPKRAAYLLARRRTLEDVRIPDTWWGRRVRDQYPDALRWRDLIRLRTDQDLRVELLGRLTPELPKATDVCDALGLWG